MRNGTGYVIETPAYAQPTGRAPGRDIAPSAMPVYVTIPLSYSGSTGWATAVLTEPFYIDGRGCVTPVYRYEVCMTEVHDEAGNTWYRAAGIDALDGWPTANARLTARRNGPSFYDALEASVLARMGAPVHGLRGKVAA